MEIIKINTVEKLSIDSSNTTRYLGYPRKVCELTADKVINENNKMSLEQLIPIALKYLSNPKVN